MSMNVDNDATPQELRPEELPIAENGTLRIVDALFSTLIVQASVNPLRMECPTISVPPGYGMVISRAANNGWTDNKDRSGNPPIALEGYPYADESEYLREARRAQLTGFDQGNVLYVGYETFWDRSRGGTKYYPNQSSSTWTFKWFMNDRTNGYTDNQGTANIDILVFLV
jgi:hypothetical protein